MITIDLNADLGEGAGTDLALLDIISSASIACGGHAGNAATMRETLRAAKIKGVTCGAHPGFADPEHFGRRRLDMPKAELETQIRTQLETIQQIANAEGVPLKYVKLHGALANMAAEDVALAETVFAIVKQHDANLAILALDNSEQVHAAKNLGLRVIREAYADRAYTSEGLLVSRADPDAVLTNPTDVTSQCLRLAQKSEIIAIDGTIISSDARSICLHGDTAGAVELARQVHQTLANAGILISTT